MTAGIGMAIISMLADRLILAWSKKRQSELGLKRSFYHQCALLKMDLLL